MSAIVFPDTPSDLPPHVAETSGTGTLTKRLREYATLIERDCGPSALTRDLREAATELEWLHASSLCVTNITTR